MKIAIEITTFKESGKYYDSWIQELEVEKDEWYYIVEATRQYRPTHPVQLSMDWVIGMDNSRNDMYPVMLRA